MTHPVSLVGTNNWLLRMTGVVVNYSGGTPRGTKILWFKMRRRQLRHLVTNFYIY